jgi:hypothetical protein
MKTAARIRELRKKKSQEWVSAESWKLDERKLLKSRIDNTRSERVKN